MKPAVRIHRVAGESFFVVQHGRRRKTWPTWQIAMDHANRIANADARERALAQRRTA